MIERENDIGVYERDILRFVERWRKRYGASNLERDRGRQNKEHKFVEREKILYHYSLIDTLFFPVN